MLPSGYLRGVDWDPWAGKPGIYVVRHYRQGWRYISSYRDGQRSKDAIFAALRQHGQAERPEDWELHHIVEGQHYADIDFGGRLAVAYQEELPCALIHKVEHIAYNQLLHIKATDQLFRDQLPADLLARSRLAARESADRANTPRLRERLSKLEALYADAYAGDAALQRIARNVLEEAGRLLR